MLKIHILAIGKDKQAWVTEAANHFQKLLKRYARVEFKALPDIKASSSLSPAEIQKRQAEVFTGKIENGTVIALSDRGKTYDSKGFSKLLQKLQIESGGTVYFLIGGPYGLDRGLIDKADIVLSLSELTFSHQLVRLVLLEQLYRGFSILAGTDYHK